MTANTGAIGLSQQAAEQSAAPIRPERLLRLPEVLERVPLGTSTIYRRVTAKTFPAPVKLGENSVAWYQSEIEEWMRALPRVSKLGQVSDEDR
nr:AlpA family transcriptional regulator [uncultured Roseococcus sp.]